MYMLVFGIFIATIILCFACIFRLKLHLDHTNELLASSQERLKTAEESLIIWRTNYLDLQNRFRDNLTIINDRAAHADTDALINSIMETISSEINKEETSSEIEEGKRIITL